MMMFLSNIATSSSASVSFRSRSRCRPGGRRRGGSGLPPVRGRGLGGTGRPPISWVWDRRGPLCLLGVIEGLPVCLTTFVGICFARVMVLVPHSFVIEGCNLVVIAIKMILMVVGGCPCVLGCA